MLLVKTILKHKDFLWRLESSNEPSKVLIKATVPQLQILISLIHNCLKKFISLRKVIRDKLKAYEVIVGVDVVD